MQGRGPTPERGATYVGVPLVLYTTRETRRAGACRPLDWRKNDFYATMMTAYNNQSLECSSGTSSTVTTDSTIASRFSNKRSNSDSSCKRCNGAHGLFEQ